MMKQMPRLSPREFTILELLISNGEMYGLELVKASSLLKRGAIYVMLARLEDKGFVRSKTPKNEKVPGKARPRYSITGEGQRVYNYVRTYAYSKDCVPSFA
jgi:DNA-binding PadR family transcriptional regulator